MKKKTFADKLWDKTGLSFWEDYSNLFTFRQKSWNWINFTFVNFYIEWDKSYNGIELELGILGLNMRWQYVLSGTTP